MRLENIIQLNIVDIWYALTDYDSCWHNLLFRALLLFVLLGCNCALLNADMMTSSNGNIFRVTGPLCGEFTGHRWIPRKKVQWRGALIFPLICSWIHVCANNGEAGDLRHHRAHYDVIVMISSLLPHRYKLSWLRSFKFRVVWGSRADCHLLIFVKMEAHMCWKYLSLIPHGL